jgi:hypothetical protein
MKLKKSLSDSARRRRYTSGHHDTLQRYRLLHSGAANSLQDPWVLSEKAPVDRDYDSRPNVGPHGASGSSGMGGGGTVGPDAWAAP